MAFVLAALMAAAPASAAKRDRPWIDVSANGVTRLADGSAQATLTMRAAPAGEEKRTGATRCSRGRMPCALLDRLDIEVGERRVEVPERAVILLADVNRARLVALSAGRYALVLECGDAAAAYDAKLFFGPARVDRLEIRAAEAGQIEQVTTYRDLSHAFK